MSGFFKTTKKFLHNAPESITLDMKHNEMLNKFKNDYNGTKPELEAEKKELLIKLKRNDLLIDERIALSDKLHILKTQ